MQKHSIEKYSLANQYPVLMSVSEGKTILLMHQYIILLTQTQANIINGCKSFIMRKKLYPINYLRKVICYYSAKRY